LSIISPIFWFNSDDSLSEYDQNSKHFLVVFALILSENGQKLSVGFQHSRGFDGIPFLYI